MTKPTLPASVEIRPAGNDVLVHDPAHDKVHVLNPTAGRILQLCDGTRSADEIALAVSDQTGAPLALVRGDVAAILAEFAALALIVP